MRGVINKIDQLMIRGKMVMMEKRDGVNQIIIMFIIIAVAAGICTLVRKSPCRP